MGRAPRTGAYFENRNPADWDDNRLFSRVGRDDVTPAPSSRAKQGFAAVSPRPPRRSAHGCNRVGRSCRPSEGDIASFAMTREMEVLADTRGDLS